MFISVFHSLFSLFLVFYGILFSSSRYDFLILFIIFAIFLSWTLYKGECPLSYYLKKYNDPNYEIGSNLYSDDMYVLFGEKYIPFMKFFYTICTPIVGTLTVYILLTRQHFNSMETILYPIIYYFYYYISFLQSMTINAFFTFVFTYILYRIVKQSKLI